MEGKLTLFSLSVEFGWSSALPNGSLLLPQELFGLTNSGAILSAVLSGISLGTFLGGPIGGYVYDITGSYGLAFMFISTLLCISSGLPFMIRKREYQIKHDRE